MTLPITLRLQNVTKTTTEGKHIAVEMETNSSGAKEQLIDACLIVLFELGEIDDAKDRYKIRALFRNLGLEDRGPLGKMLGIACQLNYPENDTQKTLDVYKTALEQIAACAPGVDYEAKLKSSSKRRQIAKRALETA